jgi:hypothetical protein
MTPAQLRAVAGRPLREPCRGGAKGFDALPSAEI